MGCACNSADPAVDKVEAFPVLLNKIRVIWSPSLRIMYKHNPSCMSIILMALIEGVHSTSLSPFMLSYMAAWLGEFLGKMNMFLRITKAVNWLEVLTVSYSKPGAYSYAVMKRTGEKLSALNHPFVFSDQFSLLLESTRLLSIAERILPSLKPKGSHIFTPQDNYAVNVNKLVKDVEEENKKLDTTSPWKKSNGRWYKYSSILLCLVVIALVDWMQVPLGLAPSQKVTGTTLELPAQLDNGPTPADTAHGSGMFCRDKYVLIVLTICQSIIYGRT